MQRHFANRGEAHSELVAAKVNAHQKPGSSPLTVGRFRAAGPAWQPARAGKRKNGARLVLDYAAR